MRQLLTESVVLALAGGALGALLAVWARDLIRRAVAPTTPPWMTFDIDGRAATPRSGPRDRDYSGRS